jgi:hypothetical protein
MLLLSLVVRLPMNWIIGFSIAIIAGHDLLDPITHNSLVLLPGSGPFCTFAETSYCLWEFINSCCFHWSRLRL